MKYAAIIAVFALVALAQGSNAQEELTMEKIAEHFETMKTQITQDLATLMNNPELVNNAQTFIADKKTQLEPMVNQMQEQLKTLAANVETQMRPLAENVQSQAQPMIDEFKTQLEAIFKKLMDQTKTIGQ